MGPSDRVYVVGLLSDPVTFGSVTLTPDFFDDFFLMALDSAGNVLWAVSFGDPVTYREIQLPVLAVDDTGDVFTVTTDGQLSNLQLSADVWVRKHSRLNGRVLWERRLDPAWNAGSIDCLPGGDVVIAGHAYGPADLGEGRIPDGAISVLALDGTTGATEWLSTFGAGVLSGFFHDRVHLAVRESDRHVILFSHYYQSFDFGADTLPMVPQGSITGASALFLGELDALGDPVRSSAVLPTDGLVNDLIALDLQMRPDGFTVLGTFRDAVDLGQGVRATTRIAGEPDGFVASYASTATPSWILPTESGGSYVAMAAGPAGESVSLGHIDEPEPTRLGAGWGVPPPGSLTSLAMVRADGAGLWELGALLGTLAFPSDVAIDASGNTYFVGAYCLQLDLGGLGLTCSGSGLHGFIASVPAGYSP